MKALKCNGRGLMSVDPSSMLADKLVIAVLVQTGVRSASDARALS
jgi:hypothetical protein